MSMTVFLFMLLQQREEARRRKEDEERLATEERTREAKKPRHEELDLEALAGQEEWEPGALSGLSARLHSLLQTRHPRRTADQDAFVSEKDKEVEVEALRERLKDMKVVARAKVTQNRVYCAAYHPDPTMDLIVFGGRRVQAAFFFLLLRLADDGFPVKINMANLVYVDARAPADDVGEEEDDVDPDQREAGKYWRLQAHWPATSRSSLSCIKFDPIDAHSASYLLTFFPSPFIERYIQVRTTLQFGRSRSPPGFRARCLRWRMCSLRVWTFPPQATSCGSRTPRDGSRTSICEREDKSKRRAYNSRTRRSGV